jgi:hypothetical protein
VTITRLITCPRQWLITDFLPYTYDPIKWHKARVGTLVQEEVARYAEAVGAQAEVKVRGQLFGIEVSGSIDLLAGSLINEGKFHAEKRMDVVMGRAKWMPGVKQLLGDDYVAQMNMQRLLVEQSADAVWFEATGQTPENMDKVAKDEKIIKQLVISHSGMEDPSWPSERAPLRDEAWIAKVRPCGGDFTVEQNVGFVANFKSMVDSISTYDKIAATVPKVGATCWVDKKGKSMCDKFCAVKRECDDIG